MQNTEPVWRIVDEKAEPAIALSDRVWGMPELAYNEHKSAAEHTAYLQAEGFRVTEQLAGIPTAMMGEAGEGGGDGTKSLEEIMKEAEAEQP